MLAPKPSYISWCWVFVSCFTQHQDISTGLRESILVMCSHHPCQRASGARLHPVACSSNINSPPLQRSTANVIRFVSESAFNFEWLKSRMINQDRMWSNIAQYHLTKKFVKCNSIPCFLMWWPSWIWCYLLIGQFFHFGATAKRSVPKFHSWSQRNGRVSITVKQCHLSSIAPYYTVSYSVTSSRIRISFWQLKFRCNRASCWHV